MPDEPEPDASEAEASPLLERAQPDKLARAVARAKIAGALFARSEPVKLGRYHLLEQVGSGGMGVVWGAWDPELDRRVAIKVVKPELASARDRIVREGQALAKLSHPHVVPVYDVGVVDEQIYLVMEWVRGKTLRGWSATARTVREITAAYRDAAAGLAAAHDAGLVHRDFKPDNAMIGDDGRVRVLDFGIAAEHGARDGRAGTPRYMAPEQAAAGELSAAVDQFSLGVALREALEARDADERTAEVPGWLAKIVARATAAAPDARFPSMHALADALARDPARVWRRRGAVAAALGLAGVAFAVGSGRGDSAAERCTGGGAEIATTWNAATRATIVTHLRGLGPYGAQVADLVGGELDGYAARWALAHGEACRAHDRGELTPALYAANLGCLTRARVALATAAEVLTTTPLARLPNAVVATHSLPVAERCRVEIAGITPPPAAIADRVRELASEVARARVLALAIDPHAVEAAEATARKAADLDYPALAGRAALVHGLALVLQQDRTGAIAAFERATVAALEANDHATAIEAIARQLYAIATSTTATEGADSTIASLKLAEPLAKGLGPSGAFVRALYYNNLGTLRLSHEDRAGARLAFEAADHARPAVATRDGFELASIAGNLGMIEVDHARRDALLDREGDELEAALGADHPMTLDARLKAAMFVDHATRSADLLRDACNRYRRMHGHLVEKIAQCAYELVWLAEERGDLRETAEALAAIKTELGPETRIAVGYRKLVSGRPAEALRELTAVAHTLAAGTHFWERWRAVDASIIAAVAAERLNDRTTTVAHLERGLVALDALGEFATVSFAQRRRARMLGELARLGAGDVTARADAAIAWYRAAGGYDARIATLVPLSSSR